MFEINSGYTRSSYKPIPIRLNGKRLGKATSATEKALREEAKKKFYHGAKR